MSAKIAMTPPLATFEDGTLIALALAGQSECFAVLINRHLAPVKRRIALRGEERSRRGRRPSGDLIESLASSIDIPIGIQFSHVATRLAINQALQSYRGEQRRPLCHALGDLDAVDSHSESPHHRLFALK
jgi:hypothetical protein